MSLSDALRLTERIAKHLRKDGRDTIFWGLASPALLCSSLPSGAGPASFGSTKCILKSNVSLRCRPNLTNDFQMAIRHHVPPPLRKMDLKHDAHEDVIAFLRELRDGSAAASRTQCRRFSRSSLRPRSRSSSLRITSLYDLAAQASGARLPARRRVRRRLPIVNTRAWRHPEILFSPGVEGLTTGYAIGSSCRDRNGPPRSAGCENTLTGVAGCSPLNGEIGMRYPPSHGPHRLVGFRAG